MRSSITIYTSISVVPQAKSHDNGSIHLAVSL